MSNKPAKPEDNEILKRAMDQFDGGRWLPLEVPEWGEPDGDALVLYVQPWTLADRIWLQNLLGPARVGGSVAMAEAWVRVIIRKACDEQGETVFTVEHLRTFKNAVDPDVIELVAGKIMTAGWDSRDGSVSAEAIEDAEKN